MTSTSGRPVDDSAAYDSTLVLRDQPGHLIRRLQQAHKAIWSEQVSTGITSLQFAVLNTLSREPDVDQRTLADLVGLDRSNTADIVNRLAQRQLLRRFKDPSDGRRKVLRLTTAGAELLKSSLPEARKVTDYFVDKLAESDRVELMRLLNILVDHHKEYQRSGD